MLLSTRRVAVICLLAWVALQMFVPISVVLANPMDYEVHPDIKNWEVHPDIENWRSPDYEVPDFKHWTPDNPEGSNPPSQDGFNSQGPGSNNPGGSSGNGEDGNGEGNWLAPLLKAKQKIISKVGKHYLAFKRHTRHLFVYDKSGKLVNVLVTGEEPKGGKSFKDKLDKSIRGAFYKEGKVLAAKNNFTSFEKRFLSDLKSGSNWIISAGLGAWSAFEDYRNEGFTTNVVAQFVNETIWNGLIAAGSGAVGSAATGIIAGTTLGAALGSYVPIVGTAIGAAVGAGIGLFLNNTSVGQKIKETTKGWIKGVADKVASWFK